jgi:hypothetical protein
MQTNNKIQTSHKNQSESWCSLTVRCRSWRQLGTGDAKRKKGLIRQGDIKSLLPHRHMPEYGK